MEEYEYRKRKKDQDQIRSLDARIFSLIEFIIVIWLIAGLAITVIQHIDPPTRLKQARDAKRLRDINAISDAIKLYMIDHKGDAPPGIDSEERQLGNCKDSGSHPCLGAMSECLDLDNNFKDYLSTRLPADPLATDPANKSFYAVRLGENGLLTVTACFPEIKPIIQVSR